MRETHHEIWVGDVTSDDNNPYQSPQSAPDPGRPGLPADLIVGPPPRVEPPQAIPMAGVLSVIASMRRSWTSAERAANGAR